MDSRPNACGCLGLFFCCRTKAVWSESSLIWVRWIRTKKSVPKTSAQFCMLLSHAHKTQQHPNSVTLHFCTHHSCFSCCSLNSFLSLPYHSLPHFPNFLPCTHSPPTFTPFSVISFLGPCPYWTRTLLSYNTPNERQKKKIVLDYV